uniref:Hoar n=1 Tax=Mamestra configurata nucleopolyhedrovirus TaxID=207830 RepID=A0A5B9GAP9_NPVMC|nr:hoar [Mamestra configurata nucleopolyhedrovirus A]
MPVAYKHVQFQHNQVTETVHVYLQTQDTSPVKHVLDINVNTKEIKYIGVSFKDHYIYSNRYEAYYNTLVKMAPGKDATAMKSLLTLITKCNIISHVLFCTIDYQRYYKKINKTNQKFCLVKDFMSKLSNKSFAEASVAFKALYERVNSLGIDRQHINFQDKIRDILHIIDKNVKVFLKKEHANLMKKIEKQLPSMFDVFTANDLDAIVTKCHRCPNVFTYHVQDNCNHNLCVNCAHKSFIDKRCIACAKDDSDSEFEENNVGSDSSDDDEENRPKSVNADDLSDNSFYENFCNSPLMRKKRSSSSNLSAKESVKVSQAVQIIQRNINDNAVTSDAFIERAASRLSSKSDASRHSNVSEHNSNVSRHSNNESNHDFDVEEEGGDTRDCFNVEDASSVPERPMDLSESLKVVTSKLNSIFDSKPTSPASPANEESAPTSPAASTPTSPAASNIAPTQVDSPQADSTTADIAAAFDSVKGKDDFNFTLMDLDYSDKATAVISETQAAAKVAETLLATETIASIMSATTTLTTTTTPTITTAERSITPDEIDDVLKELCSENNDADAAAAPFVDAMELTQAVSGILDTNLNNFQENSVDENDFLTTLENIKNEPGVDIVKLEPGDPSRAIDYYTYQIQHTTEEEPQVTIKLERDDDFFTDLTKITPPSTLANNDSDDDDCVMIEADELAFKPKKPIIKMKRVLTTLIDETEDTQSFCKRIRIENL